MTDSFRAGGADELDKAIRNEYPKRIEALQQQAESSTGPDRSAIEAQIEDLRNQCERECDDIDGKIF